MRVLVTGGRYFNESYYVASKLDQLHAELGFDWLIHGAAKSGVDLFAHYWCRQKHGVHEDAVPINPYEWDTFGKMAGSIRNRRMLLRHEPKLVIAFPGMGGTADCIKQAEELGIEVRKIGR
jgi:hypothetical protein